MNCLCFGKYKTSPLQKAPRELSNIKVKGLSCPVHLELYYTFNILYEKSSSSRLRQLGCPNVRGNHFLIRATAIYRCSAQSGKLKIAHYKIHNCPHLLITNNQLLMIFSLTPFIPLRYLQSFYRWY